MAYFEIARRNMVQGQLIPEGVTDFKILEAFSAIPREKFVPHQLAGLAYMDAEFPLEKGRALLRPALLARLFEACEFQACSKILYIGCGTGYGPALLGYMGFPVVALDCEREFTQKTERSLYDLSLSSVEVVLGPLEEGWKKGGPYDKIIIEGAIEVLPACFEGQLKEKGELIVVDSACTNCQQAVKYRKIKKLEKTVLFYAHGSLLPGFKKKKSFVFSGKETDFVYGKS